MQDIFYNQLNDREKKSLKVRLYQEDFGWGAKDKWIARDNNMRFDNNNVPLWESALKSKLVVIDYFGSTCFHECLVMNIPTIVYVPNPAHPLKSKRKVSTDRRPIQGQL
jgi:putative transferase (TIGR04331 family)